MFKVELKALRPVGRSLRRPERVLALGNGSICTSDWRGGVNVIDRHGRQRLITPRHTAFPLRPNGIALLADGTFLLAQLGEKDGGFYQLSPDGGFWPFLTELDGEPLPPSNFPLLDARGRLWLTVSTRRMPRAAAYRPDVHDGFIVLVDRHGPRIVADNLGYTNECCVHPNGQQLFVNETFARRLTAFDISSNGDLINRRTITEFGYGTYPDGLAFDREGGAWIISIISNRVIRVLEGEQYTILEDSDRDHLDQAERAYLNREMGRSHLDAAVSERLKNISSLAFGGSDLRTVYLGSLLGDQLLTFRSPIRGQPPVHWDYSLQAALPS